MLNSIYGKNRLLWMCWGILYLLFRIIWFIFLIRVKRRINLWFSWCCLGRRFRRSWVVIWGIGLSWFALHLMRGWLLCWKRKQDLILNILKRYCSLPKKANKNQVNRNKKHSAHRKSAGTAHPQIFHSPWTNNTKPK